MMEQDEKLGLYKTINLRIMNDFEREQYEYAAALGKCDNAEERQKIIDRIGVLLKYRGSMAQQLLDLEGGGDEELVNLLKGMYQDYNNLIRESLGL